MLFMILIGDVYMELIGRDKVIVVKEFFRGLPY